MVFAAAGTLGYPPRRYLGAIALGRALRYSLLAWAGDHYGRHFVRVVRHPERYVGWLVLIAGLIIAMVACGVFMLRWMREPIPLQQPRSEP